TKDLGPDVRIWGNRCIVCTRCVRFCEEVAGTAELCVVHRGDRSVVDVFPGLPLDNPLSLNVVDLCPVGALIDKNFMYSARVWFAKKGEGICVSCSRGCNIEFTALDNEIKRLVPRPNPEVNQHWMCDEGRLNFRYVASERRLARGVGTAREIAAAGKNIRFVGVVSTAQTVEELWLFRKLMDALQAEAVGFLTSERGERRTFPGGFTIEPDKTPNRAYAERLFGTEAVAAGWARAAELLETGRARGLVVLNGIPDLALPAPLVEAARQAEFVAVSDILENALTALAHVVLPGLTWAEKEGTYMNCDGRLQRSRKVVEPPPEARPEIEWLQEALVALGKREAVLSAESVFREAMPGLDYGKIGPRGIKVDGRPA
ncbi:MAG: molybdopterin-dependent oxidoreductase, partial [Planctomycetota bacterium]